MDGAPDEPDGSGSPRKPKRNHLISRKKFREFIKTHPEAAKDRPRFMLWCKTVERGLWQRFSDVKATFGTTDQVKDRVVFNLGGNKYRVIAKIDYKFAKVYIKAVLTHEEYDKGGWKGA